MRSWKLMAALSVLALGLLAVQPADAQYRSFRVSYYQDPGTYYYPAPTYYYPAVTPYVAPYVASYPSYGYRSAGVYALPGYPAVYGGNYYRSGLAPTPFGGVAPYYRSGFYFFRGR